MGCDIFSGPNRENVGVSIHAPVWGATASFESVLFKSDYKIVSAKVMIIYELMKLLI